MLYSQLNNIVMDASVDGGALGRLLEAAKAKPALLPLLQAAGDLQVRDGGCG